MLNNIQTLVAILGFALQLFTELHNVYRLYYPIQKKGSKHRKKMRKRKKKPKRNGK